MVFHTHLVNKIKIWSYILLGRAWKKEFFFHGNINWENTWEKNLVIHSKINGTPLQYSCLENPMDGGAMGSIRVGHDWVTSLSLSCIGGGNGNPLQCSCLENPRDGGTWWAAIYGVAQSRTWLKWLSSSSSSKIKAMHIIRSSNFTSRHTW